jgi:LmbE family N-acetylglucosaminyl deacetylase
MPQTFPSEWHSALVLMPHPDDPEWGGMSAAIAKWTSLGRHVRYALACRGEAGIVGMSAEQAGPLREAEQRRAAAIVGVDDVEFWNVPDGNILNTPQLRLIITNTLVRLKPDVVLTVYGGAEWLPGVPNQRDHMEFAAAVKQACDDMADPPSWVFACGPGATHFEPVDDYIEAAVASLAAHHVYLSVLDPQTPVLRQAREQIDRTTPVRPDLGTQRAAQFVIVRG